MPQEEDALVRARTASSVTAPPPIASTMRPLQTPLQPQISASGGKAATAAIGSAGALPWKAGPKIRVSRMAETSVPSRIRPKNQLPSRVSP